MLQFRSLSKGNGRKGRKFAERVQGNERGLLNCQSVTEKNTVGFPLSSLYIQHSFDFVLQEVIVFVCAKTDEKKTKSA